KRVLFRSDFETEAARVDARFTGCAAHEIDQIVVAERGGREVQKPAIDRGVGVLVACDPSAGGFDAPAIELARETRVISGELRDIERFARAIGPVHLND